MFCKCNCKDRVISCEHPSCEHLCCPMWHCVRNPPPAQNGKSVQHRAEPLRDTSSGLTSTATSTQLSPYTRQSTVLTELSRFRLKSWLVNFCIFTLCDADLAYYFTFIISLFLFLKLFCILTAGPNIIHLLKQEQSHLHWSEDD